MSILFTINDEMHFEFKGTLVPEPSSPFVISDNIFTSYSGNQLPFPSLQRYISPERRIDIQEEIDNEIRAEVQALRAENQVPAMALKAFLSARRQQAHETHNKAIHRLFEREHIKYAKYENEYWNMLMTPFPSDFNKVEAYKKREKIIELNLGDIQCRLDELFRRKLLCETTREPTVQFTATRKLPKMYKARR